MSHLQPAWMSPIETRQARADYYFQTVLDGQRQWYSKGYPETERRYLAFAICVIVLGALISVLQVFDTAVWVRHLTAALGAAVSISRAVYALLRIGETWQAYRKASAHAKKRRERFGMLRQPVEQTSDEGSNWYTIFTKSPSFTLREKSTHYTYLHDLTQVFWSDKVELG